MKVFFSFILLFFAIFIKAESIKVDGILDEPEWENAFSINEFYQTSPFNLKKSKDETVAYIFSNKDGIYVGFINKQTNASMLSKKTLRDEMTSLSDKNSVNIDFDGDGNKAYILAINLGDSYFDAIKIKTGDFKTDWDGDWIAKTKRYDGYWVSEFYLPWNLVLMNQPKGNKRKIKYSVARYRAKEQIWVASSGSTASRPDFFEKLDSLEIANYTKSRLNFFPYVSSNQNSITKFNDNKIGAEIFYNSGTGTQINATFNPDFGQAESDDVVINFSAQETFYSEKRAFFNENQSLFNINNYDRYSVMNTRRIGSAPSYDCEEENDSVECEDVKKNYSDIDYAIRYTQKKGKTELGFFTAQEHDESFSIGRNFYAIRSRTDFGNKTLGYMMTHVDDDFNNSTATVNVIDYVSVKSDQLTYFTDLLFSEKNDDSKFGYRSQFNFQPSNFSFISGSVLYFDKDFQLNDFGYLRRADWIHVGLGGGSKKIDFQENSAIDQFEFGFDLNYDSDTVGNSNPLRFDNKNAIIFKDTSKLKFEFGIKTSGKNTTITRKNPDFPFVKIKKKKNITLDFEAINYKFWTYDWRISFEQGDKYNSWDSNGYKREFYKIAGSYFPNDNLKINLQYRVRKENEWLIWSEDNKFGLYDSQQDTVSVGLNWFSGNKHEVRLKSQFVALQADNPRSLVSDKQGYLYDSNESLKPFTQGVVSFQIRYKYEIAPLSYIYLVYSKGGSNFEEDENYSKSEIFNQPWNNPSDEVYSIKFRLKY
ncbi:MAG: hypothetical protein EBX21_00125 [Proteobacteria bacterium]|jgi:hypothetical protein|nr:hypothetical protein [Pseudomonadota bacterium]